MRHSFLYFTMLGLGLSACSNMPFQASATTQPSASPTSTTLSSVKTEQALSDEALKQVAIESKTTQIVVDCNTLSQTRVAVIAQQQQVTAQTNPECAAISREYINDVSTQIQSPALINPTQPLTPETVQPNLSGNPYSNIDNAIRQAYQQLNLGSPNGGTAPRNP